MEQIIVVPHGHFCAATSALTRNGREQMERVAARIAPPLWGQTTVLFPQFTPGVGSYRVLVEQMGEPAGRRCVDFLDPGAFRGVERAVAYLEVENFPTALLIVHSNHINELCPAIYHLLFGHARVDARRCNPGQYILYDRTLGVFVH